VNDYAFKLYSKRIQDNGRVLEEMAKQAVAQSKSPDELTEKVASVVKEANLHGEHVKRVCEMANVEMFRRMYETEDDKTFGFPLVTHEKVAAINAPRPQKGVISKAAAIQEMATYIPGSEGMEKVAGCALPHSEAGMAPKKKLSGKEAIKYKSLTKREKRADETEKMSAVSDETTVHTLKWYDNGLRDTLQLVNNAMERAEFEKAAALSDVGRIGSAYLRDGATLYDVVSLLGEREITKEATVAVLDNANKLGGGISWEQGVSTDGIADPYGLEEAMDKFAYACMDIEDLTSLAIAVIDTRLEIASGLVGMEKTGAGKGGVVGKGVSILKDLLFGSVKRAPKSTSWLKRVRESRATPHIGLFKNKQKMLKEVDKAEYKRIKNVYGKGATAKSIDTETGVKTYKVVPPRFGGLVGNIEKYKLPWLAGGVVAPTAYKELKGKLAENKARATAGLTNYQPTSYGSY